MFLQISNRELALLCDSKLFQCLDKYLKIIGLRFLSSTGKLVETNLLRYHNLYLVFTDNLFG